MLAAMAEDLNEYQDDVYQQVIGLSLSSWLVPPDAVDVLQDSTIAQLDAKLAELNSFTDLQELDPLFRAYFRRIDAESERKIHAALRELRQGKTTFEEVLRVTAESDAVTVFLRSRVLWPFKHCDAYWDDVALEMIGDAGECRGRPREQYARTYVLLPQNVGWEWTTCAAIGGWPDRYTIGYSADDAGIGDLDVRRVIAVNPDEWENDLGAFYREYYPEVIYEALEAGTPQELGILLLPDLDGDIALSQNDQRWADRPLGEEGKKIGRYGCLITSLAMVLRNAYGKNVTPPALADLLLIARVPFVGDALANWADAVSLFPAFDRAMKTNGSFTAQELRALKDDGWEIVLASKALDHFVYLENFAEGNALCVIDPLDGKRKVWDADSVGGIRAAHCASARRSSSHPSPIFPDGCRSNIGLHLLGPTSGALEFVDIARPSVVKAVLVYNDLRWVHHVSPGTLLVYRHWVQDQDRFLFAPNKHQAAREWLGLFLPALQEMLRCGEVNEVWVESLNETYSHDVIANQHAIDFDLAFVEAVTETGLPLRPVVFTAAPGNPHLPYRDAEWEEQWRRILPLARRVEEMGGAFGYHAYCPVNPQWWPQWFETMAPYVHMRWVEFDKWLVAQGVYVYWMLGEVGAVYAHATPDGGLSYFEPGRGWKDCFDWPTYRDTLLLPFERMLRRWNEENGGRLLGAVVFQSGSPDPTWNSFAWEGEHLLDFARRV